MLDGKFKNGSDIIASLKQLANPQTLKGFERFAIVSKTALGISMPQLRAFAKKIGTSHELAQELWRSGIREAQMVACFVADPKQVTEQEMEQWVKDFDSWDVCDTCCQGLWSFTPYAVTKITTWSSDDREFVKRAAFALMATLAIGKKNVSDETLIKLLAIIKREATDERNFVKKAVNWALRQIGKKNKTLNTHAIQVAQEIATIDAKAARWIAQDALRELTSAAIIKRLK
jgi:3-methyladenine DNA glycosylase AlkD